MVINIGSNRLSVKQAVDHAEASFIVPLRCHMADSLEGHQSEIIGEGPNISAVLLAVGGGGVPRAPVLLGGQFELLSQLVDPVYRAGVGDCGVAVAGVYVDLVFVEGDEALVDPV